MCSKRLTKVFLLMKQKDATSLGDFPAFISGTTVATVQILGQ